MITCIPFLINSKHLLKGFTQQITFLATKRKSRSRKKKHDSSLRSKVVKPSGEDDTWLSDSEAIPWEVEEEEEEEECVPKVENEWVAEVEPGVLLTLISLPYGGNHLKKIKFSEELYNATEAHEWWATNWEKIMDLFSICEDNYPVTPLPSEKECLIDPAQSEERRESFYTACSFQNSIASAAENSKTSARESSSTDENTNSTTLTTEYWTSSRSGSCNIENFHSIALIDDDLKTTISSGNINQKSYEKALAIVDSTTSTVSELTSDVSMVGNSKTKGIAICTDDSNGNASAAEKLEVTSGSGNDIEVAAIEEEPGVFILFLSRQDGSKKLWRVLLSESFGKVKAKIWWQENKARILNQYT